MGDDHIAEQSVDSEWHSFRDQGGDTFFCIFEEKSLTKWEPWCRFREIQLVTISRDFEPKLFVAVRRQLGPLPNYS